ncbi:MAG: ATPase, T2SS/T4P/T4SS family [Candidatus Sericytochromatia bacterium]
MSEAAAPFQILSVDDDPDVSGLIRLVLKQAGYLVSSFLNGYDALAALESGALEPDLILLDVDMPTIDGYGVCQKLQQNSRWSLIPVVFLTASQSETNRLRAFQMGAVGFLAKPVDPLQLPEQIGKYLKVRQQWQQTFTDQGKVKAQIPQPAPAPAAPPSSTQTLPAEIKGFSAFKNFLSRQIQQEVPSSVTPEDLYGLCHISRLEPDELARLVATHEKLEYLEELSADQVKLGVLPIPFCRKYQIVPIHSPDNIPCFVVANPFLIELDEVLQRHRHRRLYVVEPAKLQALFSGKDVKPTPRLDNINLNELLDEVKTQYQAPAPKPEEIAIEAEGDDNAAPIIRLVNRLIEKAHHLRASDIHIEPREDAVIVRYRVDGDLREISRLQPPSLIQTLTARLKVMAGLDISERRLPQDGRIVFKEHGTRQLDIDLRVATAPMLHGEKIVMRILDKQKSTLPLSELGFSERHLQLYRSQIMAPYGMILHVGPTGSGKSMTLYAALNEIGRPEINVQTAEDPIEYTLPGISQLQVKPEIGLTFARALRAYLRQDPDVILVGEIRDAETANVSVEAALTGHLLLSTLHTNDAASTLTRFVEMGIEPYMVSASVVMICAQRLLRRLCPECRKAWDASPEERLLLGCPEEMPLQLYHPVGCSACDGIGYRGRLGVHEILVPNDELRHALNTPGMSSEKLKKMAVEHGMTTLFWDGVEKALAGLTSLEEVCARVRPDEFDSRPAWWHEQLKQR